MEYWPILAVLIALLGSFSVQRFIARRAACASFRSVFLTQLADVYPMQTFCNGDINGFLDARLPALQSAVAEFDRFVPFWRRKSFNRDWMAYRDFCRLVTKNDCMAATLYPDKDTPHPMQVLNSHVDKLLSYAKET